MLLYGDRIVVSKGLLQDMINILHETHQGIEKCKVKTTQGNDYQSL